MVTPIVLPVTTPGEREAILAFNRIAESVGAADQRINGLNRSIRQQIDLYRQLNQANGSTLPSINSPARVNQQNQANQQLNQTFIQQNNIVVQLTRNYVNLERAARNSGQAAGGAGGRRGGFTGFQTGLLASTAIAPGGFTSRLLGLGFGFQGLSRLGGGAAALGAGAAIGGIAGIGAGGLLVQAGEQYTQVERRVRLFTETSQEAEIVTRRLFEITRDQRQTLTATAEAYQAVARGAERYNLSQQTSLEITEAIVAGSRISGGSPASAQAAVIQLSQALSSGELRGQELRSLLEQNIALAEGIARGVGRIRGQDIVAGDLLRLGETGDLRTGEILAALVLEADNLTDRARQLGGTVFEEGRRLGVSFIELAATADRVAGASSLLANGLGSVSDALGLINRFANSLANSPNFSLPRIPQSIRQYLPGSGPGGLTGDTLEFFDLAAGGGGLAQTLNAQSQRDNLTLFRGQFFGGRDAANELRDSLLELRDIDSLSEQSQAAQDLISRIDLLNGELTRTQDSFDQIGGSQAFRDSVGSPAEFAAELADRQRFLRESAEFTRTIGQQALLANARSRGLSGFNVGQGGVGLQMLEQGLPADEVRRQLADMEALARIYERADKSVSGLEESLRRLGVSGDESAQIVQDAYDDVVNKLITGREEAQKLNEAFRQRDFDDALQRRIELGREELDVLRESAGLSEIERGIRFDTLRLEQEARRLNVNLTDEQLRAQEQLNRAVQREQQAQADARGFAQATLGPFRDLNSLLTNTNDTLLVMLDRFGQLILEVTLFRSLEAGLTGFFSPFTGLFGAAKGAAFVGGQAQPFAGGGVVDRPTFFGFGSGSGRRLGVAGEAGTEAIMPIGRTSSGELGVKSTGGDSRVVVVPVMTEQDSSRLAAQGGFQSFLANQIRSGQGPVGNAVRERIRSEKR